MSLENANSQFSFVQAEEEMLKRWSELDIFTRSLEQTKNSKRYIFYDGPPFATGLPHHGHLVASTLKDIIPRYFTMKGFYVERRFGWDCHGLPIEQEIDKKFGMSALDFVAEHGLKKYNDECRAIVQRFTGEWEKTISRLGRWVDFKNDYKTMDLSFMESVWWVFKEIWDKGLIYKGDKIIPYSWALQTGLSNFEATSNYQTVQDPAVTVLFKLKDEPTYLAAWTTTPWTLPSNLGLIVNANVTYAKILDKKSNKTLIIAKERLESFDKILDYTIENEFLGSELVGKEYTPLFNYFNHLRSDGAFKIHSDDYVTTDNGTGIVHAAPAFGEDDNRVLRSNGVMASALPLDPQARFTSEVTDFEGLFIKDADKEIIKNLKQKELVLHQSVIEHSYPFCPRTDTPLIYRAMPQWYLAVEKIKEQLVKANQEIHWVPDHIKDGRFGKWLEGAKDWAISRKRVWGTPLPIWENDETGNFICVGSTQELKDYSGIKLTDLHREFTDEISFTVKGEKGTYKRIPEVLDCWFESGSMPYAQLHYPFENQDVFDQGFPAEFIAEGLDQTRGWFYTLTVLSVALFNKPAFKNVIVNGLVLAKDGKKMSKRLKNYTPPDEIMNNFGADALRLFLINSALVKGEELKFTDDGVKDMVRKALLPWYNSFKFFETYAEIDSWNYDTSKLESGNILDRWIISKLQTLTETVNFEMSNYRLYNVVPALFDFTLDLTNWYIRFNRRRFWEGDLTDDKKKAFTTLYVVLKDLSHLMAPFAPFLSDHIYVELKKFGGINHDSVHLTKFPEAKKELVSSELEDAVKRMQEIILLGRQSRTQAKIKVKTPLKSVTIIHQDEKVLSEIKKLENYIKIELNVKNVLYNDQEEKFIKLFAKPNSPVLGKRLGKDFGKFRGLIEKLNSTELREYEAHGKISINGQEFENEDILLFREAMEGSNAISNRFISIDLDLKLTEDLILEGLAREVVNRIQKTRKELNFNVDDRIQVEFSASDKLKKAILQFKDYIASETLSDTIKEVNKFNNTTEEFKIEQEQLEINITKNS